MLMKTITSKWCLLILGFILSFNMYAQDTLTIVPLTGSNTCDGKAIVNHTIVNTQWTWHDSTGTNVLQTNGDTLKNLCKGNYILKFYSSVANNTKTVRFHIGFGANNPCTLGASMNTVPNTAAAGSSCNGSYTVSAINGTAPYLYSNDNGKTFSEFNNAGGGLCSANYTVIVKDKNNCTTTVYGFVSNGNNNNGGSNNGGPANNGKPCQAYWKANPLDSTGLKFHFKDSSRVDSAATITSYIWKMDGQPVSTLSSFDQLFTQGKHNMSLTINTSKGCTDTYIDSASFPNLPDPCKNVNFNIGVSVTNSTVASPNCNGSLSATISGVANYTYTWSNNLGNTNLTQNNLCPGTYTLTVTANGCTKSETRQIFQGSTGQNCVNSTLNGTISQVTPTAATGNCSGQISINANGGTLPYHFTLSNTAANGNTMTSNEPHFINLCEGTFTVTIMDSLGCSKVLTATVAKDNGSTTNNCTNSNLSATQNTTPNNSTTGNCSGSMDVFVNGGHSPYSFSTDSGKTFTPNHLQSGICAGTYTVQVKDSLGCIVSVTGTVGNGTNTGGNNGGPANNGKPCQAYFKANPLDTTGMKFHFYDTSRVDAGATITSYIWKMDGQPVGTNATLDQLFTIGKHKMSLTITTSAGCSDSYIDSASFPNKGKNNDPCANTNFLININAMNSTTQSPNCNGSLVASISGAANYTYSWNNNLGSTNLTQNNLCPGTYVLTVNVNGCTKSETRVIGQGTSTGGNNGGPANNGKPCQAYFKAHQLDTTGLKFHFYDTSRVDAGATITSYIWKMDGQPVGTTATHDQLFIAGKHNMSLTITTSASCTDTYIDSASFPMLNNGGNNNPCANNPLQVTISETNVTDATKCDGTLTATVTGVANYTYVWSNNLGTTKLNQTGLCQGNYTISVKDAITGCNVTQTRTVGINPPKNNCQGSSLAATIVTNPALNAATCNGKIIINATGGHLPYKFSADNGVTIVNTSIFNNICAGTYNVGVEDSLGCVLHLTATVALDANNTGTNPCTNSTISGLVSSVAPTKTGTCVGKVSIDAHGGKFPYSFVLTSTSSASLTTKDPHFTNLCGGNYNVKIIDSLGCSKSIYVVVPVDTTTAPNPCLNSTLAATTTSTKAFNAATCNGKIIVQATGGQAPYNYSADNGTTVTTLNVISNLCAGNYNVVVKDNLGCLVNVSATVKVDSVIVAPNPCNGTTLNGYVSALTPTATDSTCTGKFYINAKGGKAPYKFNVVNNGGASGNALAITTPFFDGLCAGNYTAVIIDSVGCIKSFPVLVPVDTASHTNPCKGSALAITFVSTNSTSLATANCNGSLTATVTGAANYTYSWDNGKGNTSLSLTGLCPGMYKLTVNANGCIKTETGLVQVGAPKDPCTGTTLNGAVIYTVPTTTANSVGKVGVYATGGAIPYTYILKSNIANGASFTSSTPNFNNLTEGTYSVIIKDSLGCTKNFIAKVGVEATTPPSNPCLNSTLYVTMTETNVSAQGQKDGSLVASVAGAVNYTYTWSNNLGSSSLTQTNLAPGIYKVKVTSNGCSFEATGKVGINVPTNPCLNSTL